MLWFAVNRSLDGVSADDLAATLATMRVVLARLGELSKTLELIARLKVRLDGDVRSAAAS